MCSKAVRDWNLQNRGGVTSVPNYMFHGCTNLVNVELSEKVTSIGNSAFIIVRA